MDGTVDDIVDGKVDGIDSSSTGSSKSTKVKAKVKAKEAIEGGKGRQLGLEALQPSFILKHCERGERGKRGERLEESVGAGAGEAVGGRSIRPNSSLSTLSSSTGSLKSLNALPLATSIDIESVTSIGKGVLDVVDVVDTDVQGQGQGQERQERSLLLACAKLMPLTYGENKDWNRWIGMSTPEYVPKLILSSSIVSYNINIT